MLYAAPNSAYHKVAVTSAGSEGFNLAIITGNYTTQTGLGTPVGRTLIPMLLGTTTPVADAHSYADADPHANSNTDAHSDPNANADPHSDSHATARDNSRAAGLHPQPNSHTNTYSDAHTRADPDSITDAGRHTAAGGAPEARAYPLQEKAPRHEARAWSHPNPCARSHEGERAVRGTRSAVTHR